MHHQERHIVRSSLEAIYATLIVLAIAGTPLVMSPQTYDSFILPKIVWTKVIVLLALLMAALRVTFGERFRIHLHSINLLLLIFLAINGFSLIVAKSTSLALESLKFLGTVIIFVFLLQDYAGAARKSKIMQRRRIVLIGWALIASAAVTALWATGEDFLRAFRPQWVWAVSKLSDWRGYVSAGLGNTNHVGDFIAFGCVIGLTFYVGACPDKVGVRGKSKIPSTGVREILTLASLLCMFAGLMVCWSVGSNAGLLIAAVLLAYLLIKRESKRFWRRKTLRLLVLVLFFCLIALFYFSDQPLNPHRPSLWSEAFSSARWHAGLPTRLAIWANTLELIRLHPWLGVGAGNFTYQYVGVNSAMVLGNANLVEYAGLYTNAAHNELLHIWAELGVFGLAAFICLVVMFYKALLETIRGMSRINYLIAATGIASMTAFLAHSMMNFSLRLPASTLIFFSLVSLPVMLRSLTPSLPGGGLLIPLEMRYRHVSLTLHLERLRYPRAIDVEIRVSRLARVVLVIILLGVTLIGVERALRAWESDRHYKIARGFLEAGNSVAAEQEFKTALTLNMEHSDCRSAYGAFLLEHNRYGEARAQLLKVNERLDSLEIHRRLAQAYLKLGEPKKEREQWQIFFNRRPQNRFAYPAQFERYRSLPAK